TTRSIHPVSKAPPGHPAAGGRMEAVGMPAPQVNTMQIAGFAADHIDPAGTLLAARHRAHRAAELLLSPRFEASAVAQAEVAALYAQEGASGSVAIAGGRVVGYLLGTPRRAPM